MRKIIPVVAAGATALAVAGGTFGYVTPEQGCHPVGRRAATRSRRPPAPSAMLLAEQGISVTDHDVVAPGAGRQGQRRHPDRGPVRPSGQVNVDGKPQTFWTTATNVDQALSALGIDTAGAELSTSRSRRSAGRASAFDVATRKTVTINAAGKKRTLDDHRHRRSARRWPRPRSPWTPTTSSASPARRLVDDGATFTLHPGRREAR